MDVSPAPAAVPSGTRRGGRLNPRRDAASGALMGDSRARPVRAAPSGQRGRQEDGCRSDGSSSWVPRAGTSTTSTSSTGTDADVRGRRVHGDADPRHRGARVPRRARGPALPEGHPHPRGGGPRRRSSPSAASTRSSSRTATCRTSTSCTGPRSRTRSARTSRCSAPSETMLDARKPVVAVCAVRTGSGKSQTTRQRRGDPDGDAASGSSSCGTRCRTATSGCRSASASPTYDDLIKHRLHDRGDGGVRAAHRHGQRGVRRRGLRADPRGGREGGGRHPLGRRQQRHVRSTPRTCSSSSPTRTGVGHELTYYPGEQNLRMADVVRHQQGGHGEARGRRRGS